MTTSPEGGTDKHGRAWVPVPLTLDNYDEKSKTYVIEFTAPKQLLLHEQFEAMVHDELLRYADRRGFMVEGQIVISHRAKGTEHSPEPEVSDVAGRDATVFEAVKHPENDDEIDAAARKLGMSEADIKYRRRMRENLRATEQEAFGFVAGQLDGKPLPEGKEFKVDRDAFREGFTGQPVFTGPSPVQDMMTVRAEALIALVLDDSVTVPEEVEAAPDIDKIVAGMEIPDDISGLDTE